MTVERRCVTTEWAKYSMMNFYKQTRQKIMAQSILEWYYKKAVRLNRL